MNGINLQNKNGQVLVSNRDVAEKFNKRHDHILRDVDSFKKDVPNFGEMYFETEEPDRYGRMQRCFDMNRDGFSLLAMGFTGKKALEWKLKYIEAFNKMEETLKSGNFISEEEKLKLKLFSKDPMEVALAHNQLVELATAPLIAENEELRPKAKFHDAVHTSVNSISVGKFSGVLQKNHIFKNFGRNKLLQWLRDNGYGESITTYKPLVTGKGQIYFTKKLYEYFQKE